MVANEYGSNNANRDMLVKDGILNCSLDSVHWENREKSKVYRDVFTHWNSLKGISL